VAILTKVLQKNRMDRIYIIMKRLMRLFSTIIGAKMFHNGSLLARETGKLADFQYKNKEA
jgi:hypothetical protein